MAALPAPAVVFPPGRANENKLKRPFGSSYIFTLRIYFVFMYVVKLVDIPKSSHSTGPRV